MHPTLRSARLRRGALVAATGALALGLLPLASSSAAAGDQVSYVSSSSLAAGARGADGTGTLTALTDAGYRTFSLDVSRDGSTALLAVCHGTYVASGATAGKPSQCTDVPNGTSYDASFGLVLVHRDSGPSHTVRAKVLSTQWDANPVLTTSGGQTSAWFLLDGVLYTYARNDTGTWNVADSSAAVTVANATAFQPIKDASTGSPVEVTTGLAVSPDGAHAAVTYLQSGLVSGRVKAASIPSGTKDFENSFSKYRSTGGVVTLQPTPSLLAYQGSSSNTLLFALTQYASTGQPGALQTWKATGATTRAAVTSLDGLYGLHETSSGPWWAWKDNGTAADLYEVSDANLLSTAPVKIAMRADGSTTYDYAPSAVTPPSLADVSSISDASLLSSPVAHAALSFSARSVVYKGRAAYASSNYYWAPLPGRAYSTTTAAEIDKGTLQWNTGNGWISGATSGAAAFGIGSKYYNGRTPVLYRNTAFRWTYAGDYLTAGSAPTASTTITVVPRLTVAVKASGASRRVFGSITRVGGVAGLYRLSGRTWRYVASATVTSTGGFNFGYRKLIKGSYKVQVAGSTAAGSWATSAKVFAI